MMKPWETRASYQRSQARINRFSATPKPSARSEAKDRAIQEALDQIDRAFGKGRTK